MFSNTYREHIVDALISSFGFMLGNCFWTYFLSAILIIVLFGYWRAPLLLWSFLIGTLLVGWNAPQVVFWIFVAVAVVANIPFLRAIFISSGILKLFKALQLIPKISDTERTALEAGVVWIEAELFSGKPDFKKILREPYPELTAKEKEFTTKKIDQLCAMASDWDLWQTRDLSPAAWDFIKKEKLFGMIIPEEHGGLGFSALAHSEVVAKISTRSVPLGVLVMVPNSLGPAELLLHYGTEAQKKKYLSRLATGEEIPCFALTEPGAGSDAGSLQASGTVFKGADGKLYVKLNWNKRWITLAAISTLLGVAFRLYDPENLLGLGEDVGITCALIPTKTPGVVVGQRHDPLGVPFYNCPTQGHDVVIDLEECVVGGREGCGRGWTMLMDCLAAGRGISLPSQGAGAGKLATRVVSAHVTNRKQFGVSIGKLEGVEEAVAKVVGHTYIMEACRKFTAGALDKGIKPPVVTAIAKYYNTELMRKALIDAMDVLGGAGISLGPRNTIGHGYIAAPIAITVEGANIMTRTLIIFGQGALRAHPYAYKEVAAIEKNDVKGFDRAFWGHIGHIVHNLFRSFVLSWTRSRLTMTPGGDLRRYYQKLSWASASFAILADIAMGTLGGKLKMKGKVTGRFADILGWMYLASSVIRRYEHEGQKEDLPIVKYSLELALIEIQKGFEGIFANLEVPGLTWFFRGPMSWWVRMNAFTSGISDDLSHKVAQMIQEDGPQRDRLTDGIYLPTNEKEGVAIVDNAFKAVKQAEKVEKKVRQAVRDRVLPKIKSDKIYDEALVKKVITQSEYDQLKKAADMRWNAIQVDDFSQKEYLDRRGGLNI
jgi:acyl-CoA dehydrogenase